MSSRNDTSEVGGRSDGTARQPQLSLEGISRSRLADAVIDQLREKILRGDIPPGTRLVQEEIAAQLGVSRTPLREAFRVLAQEGLVVAGKGGNSVEVVEISRQDALELYELREVMDGLAARLTATRHTPESLSRISEALDALVKSIDPFDSRGFSDAHTQFHIGIVLASGNTRLHHALPIVRMSSDMLFTRLPQSPQRMAASVHEHELIFEEIKNRRAPEAELTARQHIVAASRYWLPDSVSRIRFPV
jgi:DNA-binding GntR family transcriptional regulator